MAFRKQTQLILGNGKLSDATNHAHQKLRKHKDGGPVNVIRSGKVNGDFRGEPVQVL